MNFKKHFIFLTKYFKAIRRIKKENNKLKNYIEKTFEVVKNLFSFPIDRFKRIVNNFVQYFEK